MSDLVNQFISPESYVETARSIHNEGSSRHRLFPYGDDRRVARLAAEELAASAEGDDVVAMALDDAGASNDESLVEEGPEINFNFAWLMEEVGKFSTSFTDQPSASKLEATDLHDLARYVYFGGVKTYVLARKATSGVNSPISKNLKWLVTFLRCSPEETKKELETMPAGFGAMLVPKTGDVMADIRIQKIIGK